MDFIDVVQVVAICMYLSLPERLDAMGERII
jgi:hypothetical protein